MPSIRLSAHYLVQLSKAAIGFVKKERAERKPVFLLLGYSILILLAMSDCHVCASFTIFMTSCFINYINFQT